MNYRFTFTGGTLDTVGYFLLSAVITVFTLGIGYPFAAVLWNNFRCKNTFIDGNRLVFKGTAGELFWRWVLWLFLCYITYGIFFLWVVPRLERWKTHNTHFESSNIKPITDQVIEETKNIVIDPIAPGNNIVY